jgi:F-type H+-transporting ATPase subunit b
MDGQAKAGLAEALKTASDPALVRSAFDLPAEQRAAIQNALNETFSAEIHVRFETAPDLISGIELTTNGQKVAWSIADYLVSLEKGVDELLKEKDKPEAKAKPQPDLSLSLIAKRAYELYEEGRKDESFKPAKQEIRKDEAGSPKPRPQARVQRPEANPNRAENLKPTRKPRRNLNLSPNRKSKPEAKAAPKPEPKPEVRKPKPRPSLNLKNLSPETKSQ